MKNISIAVVLALGLLGGVGSAVAQSNPRGGIVASVNLQDASIRDALKILMKGVNYTINDAVQGKVTASLSNVPLETALQNILGQVGASYRYENNIYTIVPLPKEEPLQITNSPVPDLAPRPDRRTLVRIPIHHADPQYIYMLLLGRAGFTTPPEISALQGFGGGTGAGGGFGNGPGAGLDGNGGFGLSGSFPGSGNTTGGGPGAAAGGAGYFPGSGHH